jgi:hypothetical protein
VTEVTPFSERVLLTPRARSILFSTTLQPPLTPRSKIPQSTLKIQPKHAGILRFKKVDIFLKISEKSCSKIWKIQKKVVTLQSK